ncbi:MAG: hypothetical protein Q4D61_07885, partial [Cardiobacteriaceae bacterium]|nr:hypothetical protein [Cardiobacteriaceae bacterium]
QFVLRVFLMTIIRALAINAGGRVGWAHGGRRVGFSPPLRDLKNRMVGQSPPYTSQSQNTVQNNHFLPQQALHHGKKSP